MSSTMEVNNGFKETDIGILPFEWEVTSIGHLEKDRKAIELQNGFPCGKWNDQGVGIPHIRPFNVTESGTIDLSSLKYIEIDKDTSKYKLNLFDVVFNNTNSEELVGKTALWEKEGFFVISNHMTKIRLLDKGIIDSKFLSSLMHKKWFDGYYQGICRRHVNQASISLERLRQIKIPLPPLPEQQKIASVLSTIQEAKEKTENIIKATKELKKSMMKHLFTYGPVPIEDTEKVPLKETEIGMIPEHWDLECLGNLVDIRGGKRLPKGHSFAVDVTPFPYIRIVDFAKSSVRLSDLKYLTQMDRETIKRYIIKKEDIYISIAGTTGLVGTVPKELDGANLTENAARLILRDSKKIDKIYLVDFLASECGQNEIHKRATKSSQPKLALTRIKEIPVAIPSLPEQQQIADILSAINKKIACEESKRNSLDALFKTLLSLLMTGRLRVRDLEIPV